MEASDGLFQEAADWALAANIRQAIERDDRAAVGLLLQLADRLSAQGRGLEAIALRERALVLRRSFDGSDFAVFAVEAEALVLLCNTVAMQQLGARACWGQPCHAPLRALTRARAFVRRRV